MLNRPIGVVVGEDETLMREGLHLILDDAGFDVRECVADGDALIKATEHHRPDLVITDIRMPPDHRDEGLRASREIKGRWPEIGVMLLSHHTHRGIAVDLVREHATGIGYLLKQRIAHVDRFVQDLVAVADGQTVLDPEVVSLLLSGAESRGVEGLTERQKKVLTLMARGLSNTAIAIHLSISEKSVVHYVSQIYRHLHLPVETDSHRRVQAVITFLASTTE